MNEFIHWISHYGVSIVISIYLVYWITNKLNSKLDKLVENINTLNTNIEKLINLVTARCKCGE